MDRGIRLIVGLGNPGEQYARTRHNAGFRFLDALVRRHPAPFREESRFKSAIARAQIADREIVLLAPTTYMNESGQAVAAYSSYYKIPPRQILIAHDELDLPPGTVRLKVGGGDGGHNGLHDIVTRLGTNEFVRLRIGIGHPGSAAAVVSYVLRPATAEEEREIDAAIDAACAQIEPIVAGEFQRVMNLLHVRGPAGG